MDIREFAKRMGYGVHELSGHGGRAWDWHPKGSMDTRHFATEDAAWRDLEKHLKEKLDWAEKALTVRRDMNSAPLTARELARRAANSTFGKLLPPYFEELSDRLRELRLWHWKEAQRWRRDADDYVEGLADKQAGKHLKFVQTLNDFFPIGDTAENDAEKAK